MQKWNRDCHGMPKDYYYYIIITQQRADSTNDETTRQTTLQTSDHRVCFRSIRKKGLEAQTPQSKYQKDQSESVPEGWAIIEW